MKLLRVGPPGRERPAVLGRDGRLRDASGVVRDIDGALLSSPWHLQQLAATAATLPLARPGQRIGSPVARPGKVVGIGLNYGDHAVEAGLTLPDSPVVFLKAPSAVVGPFDDICLPPGSSATDWEVELGVVVGRPLSRCSSADEALAAVAGYLAADDVTERTLAADGPTWAKGKCSDTFLPLGPWLVTPDEVPDPQALALSLSVNGRLRQSSSTKQMAVGVGELLCYVSSLMTLEPGDLLLTGTPGGVGLASGTFLRDGDVVELEVEGLGQQRNVVVADAVSQPLL
ncbi:MAG TPA: fumarylacetoacetate hydrolase family protein [Marmoricola sp.]|nr:fumarylacetoacetate hydrolase family protein [Marmoricola sp.]